MSRSVRAWQGEDGDWTIWGTHDPCEAENACYRHLVDDVGLSVVDGEDDELWDLMPAWSDFRANAHALWADRDLVDLEGQWPRWKFSHRWRLLRPLRVRVLRVLL